MNSLVFSGRCLEVNATPVEAGVFGDDWVDDEARGGRAQVEPEAGTEHVYCHPPHAQAQGPITSVQTAKRKP